MVPETIPSPLVGASEPDTSSIADKILSRRSALVRKREDIKLEEDEEKLSLNPIKKPKLALNGDIEVKDEDEEKLPLGPFHGDGEIKKEAAEIKEEDVKVKDEDKEEVSLSSVKKARVAFNEDVEVNLVDDWNKAPELIREEVHRALKRHAFGDSDGYDKIKQVYKKDGQVDGEVPSPEVVKYHTAALLSNVALLDRSCSGLVYLVLGSDWVWQDDDYVSLFTKLLGNLVSAQGIWLGAAMEMLVRMFLAVPKPKDDQSRLQPVPPAQIRRRIHVALRTLLRLVPSGSNVLASVLDSNFPGPSSTKRAHVRYVHNLLAIIDYAPELRCDIYALITDRVVKIDVQVQIDIAGLADEAGDGIVRDISQSREEVMDASDGEDSEEDSDDEDEGLVSESQKEKRITANIEKLDLMLDILFETYDALFSDPKQSTIGLDTLLAQFNSIILPTYRSRHTQFLLFHFAQSTPELVDIFIGILLRTAFDKSCAAIIRQASTAYLASFVARGKHVSTSIVRDVFDYISEQLSHLRAQYVPGCRGPDPRRYSLYYALVQALLYIFCFRWRDLTITPEDSITPSPPLLPYGADPDEEEKQHPTFLPGIRDALSQNVLSKLNPLRVCASVIAEQFASMAYHLGVMYVYALLESNKRVPLAPIISADRRETALTRKKGDEWQRLDGYFPFDPYRLPRSKRWVEGDYREWTNPPGMNDEDGSESEEEDAGEDGGEDGSEGTRTEGEDEG